MAQDADALTLNEPGGQLAQELFAAKVPARQLEHGGFGQVIDTASFFRVPTHGSGRKSAIVMEHAFLLRHLAAMMAELFGWLQAPAEKLQTPSVVGVPYDAKFTAVKPASHSKTSGSSLFEVHKELFFTAAADSRMEPRGQRVQSEALAAE